MYRLAASSFYLGYLSHRHCLFLEHQVNLLQQAFTATIPRTALDHDSLTLTGEASTETDLAAMSQDQNVTWEASRERLTTVTNCVVLEMRLSQHNRNNYRCIEVRSRIVSFTDKQGKVSKKSESWKFKIETRATRYS